MLGASPFHLPITVKSPGSASHQAKLSLSLFPAAFQTASPEDCNIGEEDSCGVPSAMPSSFRQKEECEHAPPITPVPIDLREGTKLEYRSPMLGPNSSFRERLETLPLSVRITALEMMEIGECWLLFS